MIRAANEADLAGLVALQGGCWSPAMQDSPDEILARLRGDFVIVAEDHGAIVGAAFAEHRRGSGWHLYVVEVLPEHRRRGIGSELVGALLRHLAVPMTADAVTPEGRALLECAGFAPVAVSMRHAGVL